MKKILMIFFTVITYLFPAVMTVIGAYLLYTHPMFDYLNNFIIGILAILVLLVIVCLTLFILKKSTKGQIITIVLGLILGLFVTACDVVYYDLIQTMSNITNTEGDKITSDLYVLKDSDFATLADLQGHNIAVQPSTSISMNELLLDAIKEAELSHDHFTLSQYTNYVESYEDFLKGDVDAIVLDEAARSTIKEVYPEFDEYAKSIATFSKIVEASEVKDIDVASEPFTVLISGIDARSTDLNAYSRSDVIMIAAFNPQTLKLSLTSVPRDTYLPVTCRGFSDKITHSGTGGIQCTETSLEQAFDVEIDYYVKVNFTAVVDIVDALGGIELDVPFAFTESNSYDTPNSVTLTKGYQTIDGEQALALCRHRNTLPRGDIDRGLNQQLVIQALLNKVASSSSVMNVDKLLDVLGSNIATNMPTKQMYGLFSLLTDLATNSKYGSLSALNIQTHTIDGAHNMHTPSYNSFDLYFYMPYEYSMKNTTRNIKRILGEDSYPVPTNTFAFNANVPYDNLSEDSIDYMDNDRGSTSYAIPDYIDYGVDGPSMPDFTGQTYADILAWANTVNSQLADGYSISVVFQTTDGSEVIDGATFVSSSISAGVTLDNNSLVEGVNVITFVMENPIVEDPDTPDTPDTPDMPDTPDTPDTPENPDTPDNPETPDTPETPVDPNVPEDTGTETDIVPEG